MNSNNAILIVCNRVPFPLKDGGSLAMFAMIKGWHNAGRPVHLLAMNTKKHHIKQADLPELFGQIASFEMVPMDTQIKVLPTLSNFIFSKKPQHAQRFYAQHFEQKIIEKIQQIQPEIIQLESIYLQEYAPAIRQHSKALLMQRLHNIEAEIWYRLAEESSGLLKKWYLNNLAKRIEQYEEMVWQDADALIAISSNDEHTISRSRCTTPICIIPFGIDMDSIALVESINLKAYHLGAMDWQPNIEAMEWMRDEIAPTIHQKTPDFQFQFAGRKMPEWFTNERNTFFSCSGEVEDARNFIQDKGILIVPLRSGSGIRIKTLEAMAEGKLVISTSVGIQGIEAQDKIHFLQADAPQEFAAAIEWVFAHKEEAMHIAQNAQNLIKGQYNQKMLQTRLIHFAERLA
jgi:glycosyltransferase involved in cell wall biosynthesis